MKILIVEDNLINMRLVSALLTKSGYIVIQTVNADEGIAAAKNELPDLILMDIRLPDMDGMEAAKHLQRESTTCHIPVIALTAQAMKGDRENILGCGFAEYVEKPIVRKEFLATVHAWTHGRSEASKTDDHNSKTRLSTPKNEDSS